MDRRACAKIILANGEEYGYNETVMILSVGEILADIFFDENGSMSAKLGGAPFNMAVSAKQAGSVVAFSGRVGDDLLGRWLSRVAEKYGLDELSLQFDKKHDTTIAMVTVDKGERSFQFLRKFSADYYIEIDEKAIKRADIVHVGSLMLSEKRGRILAKKLFDEAEEEKKTISFDVNYRSDLFSSEKQAKNAYLPFLKRADILKFSEEEIKFFTGLEAEEGVKTFKNKLVCVTLGEKGSMAYKDGVFAFCPSEKVTPVDTTGAGDAFYGAFLAGVERMGDKDPTEEDLLGILREANRIGAETTLFYGALKS